MKDYQEAAIRTAVYPERYRIAYPCLGLIGELGELDDKIDNKASKDSIIAECGDIFWYAALLCYDLGIELDNLNLDRITSKDYREYRLAEVVKKICRDDVKDEKIVEAKACIEDIIMSLMDQLEVFDIKVEIVLENNIAKLFSRQQRGVLKGDGDNR